MADVYIVTPCRDEAKNLPKLFAAIQSQSIKIRAWIIVENGSTDGTKEALATFRKPDNVCNLIVLNEDTEDKQYALGAKYARIVSRGFTEITKNFVLQPEDLIGINDADSFPEEQYFEKLANEFVRNPQLGISSGFCIDTETGRKTLHSKNWVLGSCRLWRYACFVEAGYIIGPSADTLSLAKAELRGWQAKVTDDTYFCAREVGSRSKQQYYGAAAYYRGNTPTYAGLRAIKFAAKLKIHSAIDYCSGYFTAMARKEARIEDPELREYFRNYIKLKLSLATKELVRKIKW